MAKRTWQSGVGKLPQASRNRTTRRRIVGSALPLGAALLAACAPSPGEAPAASKGPVALTWMLWDNPDQYGHKDALDLLKQKRPELAVELQLTTGNFEEKWLARMAAGDAPDISQINDDYTIDFHKRGLVRPLTEYIKKAKVNRSEYYKVAFEYYVVDGHVLDWFLGYKPYVLWYNVDLFEKAGIPLPPATWKAANWSWNELLDVARRLTRDTDRDGTPDEWGLIYDGHVLNLVWHNGGSFVDDSRTKLALHLSEATEAIQWWADLALVHRVSPTVAELRQRGAMQRFVDGKVAMLGTHIAAAMPAFRRDIKDFRWDITTLPTAPGKTSRVTYTHMNTYMLPTGTRYPEASWEVLSFMTSEPAQRVYSGDKGYEVSARPALCPLVHKAGQPPAHATIFCQAMETSRNIRQIERFDALWREYTPILARVRAGEVTARAAFTEFKPRADALLAGQVS